MIFRGRVGAIWRRIKGLNVVNILVFIVSLKDSNIHIMVQMTTSQANASISKVNIHIQEIPKSVQDSQTNPIKVH